MKNVLVTGAAGFIGSNLSHYLIKEGYRVTALDAFKTGSSLDNIWDLNQNSAFSIYNRDLVQEGDLVEIFEKHNIDTVIHLAAESHVDRSIESNLPFWETQVIGTQRLLEAAQQYGKIQCVINQITDEAYGEVPEDSAPPKEGAKFEPNPFYAASKVAQYYVGQSFWKTYKLPVISTFPVNNYGPRQWPEKLIPKFVTLLLEGKKVPLMKSTHFQRDWLPVIDMAIALETIMLKGTPGESYNVGADNHCTNIQLTHKLLKLLDKDESSIEIVPDRATHDCRYAVDYSKLENLGWTVTQDFDEYLEYTVEWYKDKFNETK
jgi:dTDP-glucose 4,6-dehydratase